MSEPWYDPVYCWWDDPEYHWAGGVVIMRLWIETKKRVVLFVCCRVRLSLAPDSHDMINDIVDYLKRGAAPRYYYVVESPVPYYQLSWALRLFQCNMQGRNFETSFKVDGHTSYCAGGWISGLQSRATDDFILLDSDFTVEDIKKHLLKKQSNKSSKEIIQMSNDSGQHWASVFTLPSDRDKELSAYWAGGLVILRLWIQTNKRVILFICPQLSLNVVRDAPGMVEDLVGYLRDARADIIDHYYIVESPVPYCRLSWAFRLFQCKSSEKPSLPKEITFQVTGSATNWSVGSVELTKQCDLGAFVLLDSDFKYSDIKKRL